MWAPRHASSCGRVVSVRDVLAAISPEALDRLRDAVFELTEYSEDEPDEERLVRALIEPELPDGSTDEWFHPYSELGFCSACSDSKPPATPSSLRQPFAFWVDLRGLGRNSGGLCARRGHADHRWPRKARPAADCLRTA